MILQNTFFRALFIVLISLSSVSAQSFYKLTLTSKGKTAQVLAHSKDGQDYISLLDFAGQFGINTFISPDRPKQEIKSSAVTLKFTAFNPFIVVSKKADSSQVIHQLPVSTLLLQKQIFVPLVYTAPFLSLVTGEKITFSGTKTEIPNQESVEETNPAVPLVNVDEKTNGTLVYFAFHQKLKKPESSFKDGKITITLRGLTVKPTDYKYTRSSGVLRKITATNRGKDAILELSVTDDYTSYEISKQSDTSFVVSIFNRVFSTDKTENPKKEKWEFDVIVIDAGHGGKDFGAIGVHNTVEKEINLAVALKLGQLITKNLKGVKVVYTRKDDTFVELYKRGKIANENNGKLFISIHCNSVPGKKTGPNGYEIYLLRPGRTKEAIRIAERENSVISYEEDPGRYQKLTDENFILVSMAHSSYMKYSEKFADILNQHLRQTVEIESRGIKQAGFYVLVGASMPGILFETGYVTNEDDARYMKSKEGQEEIARAIFEAIKSFKNYYNDSIQ